MKRWKLWAVVAGLLVSLHLLQTRVLEKTEVQRLERESQDLGELSAAQLPTYVGTLFLGSFRAVAIDILWIQMARMREQEHRYFETVELMELITRFQPRNPEAWSYMAWDAGGNIASQFRTEEDVETLRALEKQASTPELEARKRKLEDIIRKKDTSYRTWVKLGLRKLTEACRHMPDDPYLRYEIGGTLWTKSAWSAGVLDRQFMKAIEEDDELQRLLAPGLEPRRRTTFELAIPWFEDGMATLEKLIRERRFRVYLTLAEILSRPPGEDRQHHTTQGGRNIDVAAFVGAILQQEYLAGVLKWYRAIEADPDAARALLTEASGNFRRAAEQAVLYRREHSPIKPGARSLHDARAELFRFLADLCAEQAGLPHPLPEKDRAAILSRLEGSWWSAVDREQQIPPADDRYVSNYMGMLKRSLGGDGREYNDDRMVLDREDYLAPGEFADATIGPDLGDIDWYHFYAAPPRREHQGHHHEEETPPPPGPITARFEFTRVGDLPLKVTTFAFYQGKVAEKDVTTAEFEITTDREGPVYIRVSAASTAGDASRSGYRIKALGVQR